MNNGSDEKSENVIRTREELQEEFERSGLNAAAFARRHDISYSTFRYWHKRAARSPVSQRPTLIEVVQKPQCEGGD